MNNYVSRSEVAHKVRDGGYKEVRYAGYSLTGCATRCISAVRGLRRSFSERYTSLHNSRGSSSSPDQPVIVPPKMLSVSQQLAAINTRQI